jgi:hypothetical protein
VYLRKNKCLDEKSPEQMVLAFFFFWLLVLLAGMDKPPPRGFSWVRLIVAICAALSPIFSIVVGAAVAVRCVINP